MEHIPQITPITHMRLRHRQVLAMLGAGPVILSQHGKAAAVLLSVGEWENIAAELKRLHHLELHAELQRIKAKGAPGVPLAEVKRRIAAKQTTHVAD